jgi:hypothetical protein
MNATPEHARTSWLQLLGSPQEVLGPSRGHVPDLAAYRVAYVYCSPSSLWLFGSVTGMPAESESNGERNGVRKFNLALDVSPREIVELSGSPMLDAAHDDSTHSFELALPVVVTIEPTAELVWPDAEHKVLALHGTSSHLNFRVRAMFVRAYGGKHARKRFVDALHVGY